MLKVDANTQVRESEIHFQWRIERIQRLIGWGK